MRIELDGGRNLREKVCAEALEILLLGGLERGDNVRKQMIAQLQA